MWLFTERGFMSVVQNENDEKELLVRFRVKSDADDFIKKISEISGNCYFVTELKRCDYKYRVYLHKKIFQDYLIDTLNNLDYSNFKERVLNPLLTNDEYQIRSTWYHAVWNEGSNAQIALNILNIVDSPIRDYYKLLKNEWPVLYDGIRAIPIKRNIEKGGWGYIVDFKLDPEEVCKVIVCVVFGKSLTELKFRMNNVSNIKCYSLDKLESDGWFVYKINDNKTLFDNLESK